MLVWYHFVSDSVETQIGRIPGVLTQLSAVDRGGWDEGGKKKKNVSRVSIRRTQACSWGDEV